MLWLSDAGCLGWARTVDVVSATACPHAWGIVQVSDEQMKELAVKTETTNPWYWGVRTLVKVGPVRILLDRLVTNSFYVFATSDSHIQSPSILRTIPSVHPSYQPAHTTFVCN